MIGTILLIVAFQVYWLTTLYHEEEQSMRKTVDVVFRESMYKLQAERFKNDTSIFFKSIPDENIFLGDVASAVKISLDDSNAKAGPFGRGGTLVVRGDSNREGGNSAMHHFSYNVQLSKTDSSGKKPVVIVGGFAKSGVTSQQKITPAQIDSLLKNRKIIDLRPGHENDQSKRVTVYRNNIALPSQDVILQLDINDHETVYTATEIKSDVNKKELKEPSKGKKVTKDEFRKLQMDAMQNMNMPGGGGMRTMRFGGA